MFKMLLKLFCYGLCFLSSGLLVLASVDELIDRSPFLPPDYRPRVPPAAVSKNPNPAIPSRRLELTGMIEIDGLWSFSFFEPAKKRSFWVKMNDPKAEVKVLGFDPQSHTVTLDTGSGKEKVTLKASSAPTGALWSPNAGTKVGSTKKSGQGASSSKGNTRPTPGLSAEDEAAALKILDELFGLSDATSGPK